MIALRDEIPLIQLTDGQAVAFERQWLMRSLARAARKAGYPQWWLAEHVVESVAEYLRTQRDMTDPACGTTGGSGARRAPGDRLRRNRPALSARASLRPNLPR